jgi:hypothetical protein
MVPKMGIALLFASALGLPLIVGGCGRGTAENSRADAPQQSSTAAGAPAAVSESETEHGHKPGEHGGIMVSLGRDSYHVEAVFEKNGVLRLYTLGQDESRVIDVERQTLKGFVRAEGVAEAQAFTLEPEIQGGDATGRTSRFMGTLPEAMRGQNLEVTVPNIVIAGERFRLGFKSAAETHDEGMPDKVVDADEEQLYLTPGGIYTKSDIRPMAM